MKGLVSRPAAGWAGWADFIQNRLWGLTEKLEVESGCGLFSYTLCLPEYPCDWRALVGFVWLGWRWDLSAVFRETKGWGKEEKG